MGAQRRQHHRREAAKRQAGIDATAMRIAQEEARRRQQQEIDRMREFAASLTPDEPPRPVQSTLDAARTGVRTARSRRGTGLSRGLAALRIPLNIGGGTGGGLNIG
jgi:hypothetical protein